MSAISRRKFVMLSAIGAMSASALLAGCSSESANTNAENSSTSTDSVSSTVTLSGDLALDQTKWNYDADNDVYWQVEVPYCTNPASLDYETLGIYIPGEYMDGTQNSDGTYTCSVNEAGSKNYWSSLTAPFVIPVNTAGYSAQAAPTTYSYQSVADYIEAGFIYVYPGCRGRDNGYADDGTLEYAGGAPWGVTDLKASIRYLRYNASYLPGNANSVFTFGHSGGGAQSAIVGASGDSELFTPYLEDIGAAMEDASGQALSDATMGAMCWCPITSLDEADAAYEWMMGQYSTSGTRAEGTWTKALSGNLAQSFADYINSLGLEKDGIKLTLDPADDGIYTSGTYYDYIKDLIETTLNNFLSDNVFPYISSSSTMADGGFGQGLSGDSSTGRPSDLPDSSGDPFSGNLPSDNSNSSSENSSGNAPEGSIVEPTENGDAAVSMDLPADDVNIADAPDEPTEIIIAGDDITTSGRGEGATKGSSSSSSVTYGTAQDYIDSLNGDDNWITYDPQTNRATITSIEDFVTHLKNATKDVGAFDDIDRSQAENKLFGTSTENALHFDATLAELLKENEATYSEYSGFDASVVDDYANDRQITDDLGVDVDTRVNMYNPLYYLSPAYEGYGTSVVAPYWRIRTGIEQTDTSLTVEANLSLILEANEDVEDVDFATVWGQGHTTAERTGSSTDNFIDWVNDCLED
ncbi:MAG: esterase [Eggerthellaceae bacterium]|nr:esterase [Eggerthellaceae bacterium]